MIWTKIDKSERFYPNASVLFRFKSVLFIKMALKSRFYYIKRMFKLYKTSEQNKNPIWYMWFFILQQQL